MLFRIGYTASKSYKQSQDEINGEMNGPGLGEKMEPKMEELRIRDMGGGCNRGETNQYMLKSFYVELIEPVGEFLFDRKRPVAARLMEVVQMGLVGAIFAVMLQKFYQ